MLGAREEQSARDGGIFEQVDKQVMEPAKSKASEFLNLKAPEDMPAPQSHEPTTTGFGQLTPKEVAYERVALAVDMISLLLTDDERLPPLTHATLLTMHRELVRVWNELRVL
mgnify:CR=1 FL=1